MGNGPLHVTDQDFKNTVLGSATPVLVDIDPVTYTIDPNRIEAALTPRTKAIMPVHLFGQMAAMEEHVNIDEAKLPPALRMKWDRLLTRIAETTVMGVCPPLD